MSAIADGRAPGRPAAQAYTAAEVAMVAELARDHPLAWAMHASGWARDRKAGTFTPRYQLAPHLRFLGKHLMRIHRGECRRLLVSMPPRHGKTLLTSRFFLGWWLGKHPDHRVITTTYQARLAQRWSRNIRNDLVQHGPRVFGVAASARAAADDWDLLPMRPRRDDEAPVDGGISAVGIGGALTGKGANVLNGDDLVQGAEQVRNPQVRDNMWDSFEQDLMTRLEPDGAALITMTRWHADDIPGRIIKSQAEGKPVGGEPWEVINLPALAEADDPMGRAPGEALWEDRWSREKLERMRAGMSPEVWDALFQGHPTLAAGNLFKRAHLQRYRIVDGDLVAAGVRIPLAKCLRFVTVDPAFTAKTRSNPTAIAMWAFEPERGLLFLLEMRTARLEPHQVGPAIALALKDANTAVAYVESDTFHGEEMVKIRMSGVPIYEIRPFGDKVGRATAAASMAAQGRLLFPAEARWLASYEEELLTFPQGADDRVDATSYGVHAATKLLFLGVTTEQPVMRRLIV